MLEKLIIWNFQKHKKRIIYFDPHITTLWGKWESGKSTILRALRWLALNKRPDDFINWDADFAKVLLIVDGHRIVRKQGERENLYSLDGEVYRAFNKDVPDPIKNILLLSETNFQTQHEAHFWVSLSPAQVSKELNQIIDLSAIDKSLSSIVSRLRKCQTKITLIEQRIEEAKEKRKSLLWVAGADDLLTNLEVLQQHLADEAKRRERLKLLIAGVATYQSRRTNLEEYVTNGQKLLSKWSHLLELRERVDQLRVLIDTADKRASLLKIKVPNIAIVERYIRLQELISSFREQRDQSWKIQSQYEKATLELNKVKVCPVCGKPIES